MTKQEAAIIMAFTGINMFSGENFNIYHKYVQELLGRPVWTHELANIEVFNKIKELSKPGFLKLCENLKD